MVDAYYAMQENRIHAANQVRALTESGEPADVLAWLMEQNAALEKDVAKALDAYSGAHPVGKWMRSVKGIGPVIAAGLLAHIDITKAPTVGHIWSFAGLDPTKVWKKGEKRPWNARLKVLCWKIGESFVKVSGIEDAFYGKVYAERKAQEVAKSAAGEFADQAAASLAAKKFGKDTDAFKAYEKGELPNARLHLRAERYAVKLFLAHLHQVWREIEGLPVVAPYPIAILGHAHKIEPPMAESAAGA